MTTQDDLTKCIAEKQDIKDGVCKLSDEKLKEEYVQNNLQYRWLDTTRSKLLDRVFVFTAALILARLKFSEELTANPGWLLLLHMVFIIVSGTLAYSIVRYRRQQRGHGEYILEYRKLIFKEYQDDFTQYKSYVEGKYVYLTFGVEASVVLIAVLSPFLLTLDKVILSSFITSSWLLILVTKFLPVILCFIVFCFVVIPFLKYNFSKKLDWKTD